MSTAVEHTGFCEMAAEAFEVEPAEFCAGEYGANQPPIAAPTEINANPRTGSEQDGMRVRGHPGSPTLPSGVRRSAMLPTPTGAMVHRDRCLDGPGDEHVSNVALTCPDSDHASGSTAGGTR